MQQPRLDRLQFDVGICRVPAHRHCNFVHTTVGPIFDTRQRTVNPWHQWMAAVWQQWVEWDGFFFTKK